MMEKDISTKCDIMWWGGERDKFDIMLPPVYIKHVCAVVFDLKQPVICMSGVLVCVSINLQGTTFAQGKSRSWSLEKQDTTKSNQK